jgi:hypothetical protein
MATAGAALAIVLFMTFYYRVAGLFANVVLVLNIVLTLAGLAAFGATLTLPGIAGIILTIVTAVDANVLIYERIREELAWAQARRGRAQGLRPRNPGHFGRQHHQRTGGGHPLPVRHRPHSRVCRHPGPRHRHEYVHGNFRVAHPL